MQILIFITALVVGCLMGFLIKPNANFDYRFSRVYIIVASLLVLNAALVNFANIQNAATMNTMIFVLNWGKSLSFLLIGYLISHILQVLNSKIDSSTTYPLNKIIRSTLWAIMIINGFSFIIETGYKLKNFDDLVAQFAHYGYARWFLYFIIVTETLGGIGILLQFKLKTGLAAALGLMIIMLGVVYTDWHSNNPFTYSFPAVDAFISLALMTMIFRLEKGRNHFQVRRFLIRHKKTSLQFLKLAGLLVLPRIAPVKIQAIHDYKLPGLFLQILYLKIVPNSIFKLKIKLPV
jgi:uncharacterized membrane protein YphA (DoxX/SURF4 family)